MAYIKPRIEDSYGRGADNRNDSASGSPRAERILGGWQRRCCEHVLRRVDSTGEAKKALG